MPTLKDVAALAQVSYQTVSRALNDPGAVRPATRARIDAAIEALDYRPDEAARALRARRRPAAADPPGTD